MKICGIYSITSPSGGQYIGSSTHVKKRWGSHRSMLRSGTHHSIALQRAFDKYGEDGLAFAILHVCLPSELVGLEQMEMDARKPAYNRRPTAESQLGFRHSEESKRLIASKKTGLKQSTETIERRMKSLREHPNWGIWNIGRKSSMETRAKQSASMRGVIHRDGFVARLDRNGLRGTVIAEYVGGMGIVALEKRHRTTHQSIRALLDDYAIYLRPAGGPRRASIQTDES